MVKTIKCKLCGKDLCAECNQPINAHKFIIAGVGGSNSYCICGNLKDDEKVSYFTVDLLKGTENENPVSNI